MYYDPIMVTGDSIANSYRRSGTSSSHPLRQRTDYGTQPLPGPMVKSFSRQSEDQLIHQSSTSSHQMQYRICAFSDGQVGDLSIGDPPILVAPCPPNREPFAKGSATGSFSACSSRRADRAPLRAIHPSIAQEFLQAIGNPSLRQAANFSAQPNLGPPQPGQQQPDLGMVLSRPIFEPSYQFYNAQPREDPCMALTYLPLHKLTPYIQPVNLPP
ncbi:hypothetical protein AMTR_s00008p00267950 [Amborella trichopoda]|uniref:Uncharacterized protein n=1 Tax=Amborella trichopoda TaxID=13333 RepID=W1NIY6_AMBTC|nr:hypothetical protein AMTR_s00008p00267950 [Amborella trichopoda]